MRSTLLVILTLGCACGQLAAADPVVTVPYTVTQESRVSLALYDSTGKMVRTLLTGAPRKAGSYVATWDGRDRYGGALPAGTYTWKQATSTGLTAEFICQIGQNDLPAWSTGTGNHSSPAAVAVDSTGVYRFGQWNEGTNHGAKTDFNGNLIWTNNRWDDGWNQYGQATVAGNGNLYDLGQNGTLWGYNATTGRCFTNGDYDPKPWNIRWGGDADASDYTDTVGVDIDYDRSASLVVVSYQTRNGIRWINGSSGASVAQVTTVTAPVSVSVASNGTVYAISQGAVVSLTRTASTPVQVIAASALTAPWRISVDPTNGDLWIAENSDRAGGAAHHQVKRFSSAGTLLHTYGAAAGRQDGAYVPTDFRGITDITADGQGGFLIAEKWYAPRRIARFAANGSLLREWFGAQEYGVAGAPEPGDPTHAWFHVNAPTGQVGIVRTEIDLVTKTWKILETYTLAITNSLAGQNVGGSLIAFANNGHIYLSAGNIGTLWLAIYDPAAKRLRICNASGNAYKDGDWQIPTAIRPTNGSTPGSFLWNDLNDDGVATLDEMTWDVYTGGVIRQTNLELVSLPVATGFNPGPRYVPTRITAGGTPVYGAQTGTQAYWHESAGGATDHYYPGDLRWDDGGSVYGCIAEGFPGWEEHGRWYFNSTSGINRLMKWDAAGNQLWSVGRHSPDPDHAIGSQSMPRSLVGLTHNCIIWADSSDEEYIGSSVWTSDGLWVGEIPTTAGTKTDEWIHNCNGNEYSSFRIGTDSRTGDVLFFGQSAMGGVPVYRINGWNAISQSSGTVALAAPMAAFTPAGTGLSAAYFNNVDLSGTAALTRVDPDIYVNWSSGPPDAAINSDNFSGRWTGRLLARTTGETSFSIEGNKPWQDGGDPDTAKLWVDGQLVLDWATAQENGRVMLKAGEFYDIRLEASFTTGGAALHLCWETDELDRRRIEQRFLYPTGTAGTKYPGGQQAQWHLDETSGSSAADASSNGASMTTTGTAWTTTGRINGGMACTGGTGAGTATVNVSETARTVSLWFLTTQANGGLFSTTDGASASDGDIYLSGGRLLAKIGSETIQTARTTWNDGQWHHVVHVLGGPDGGQRLYVDGDCCAAGSTSASTFTAQTQVRIGRSAAASTQTLTGSIDEVRIYDRALSARAVRDDIYRREVGLIAHLTFDEGAGIRANSLAGTEVFATLAGNSSWTTGKFGTALRVQPIDFTPTIAYLDGEARVPTTDYTVACWFRTSDPTLKVLCVDRDSPYNWRFEPLGVLIENGLPGFWLKGQTSTSYGANRVDNGAWHHLAITVGGIPGGSRMYIDGVLAASHAVASHEGSNRMGIDLGGGGDVELGRDGTTLDVDDTRIYGRALAAAEILALKNLTPTNPVSPPSTPAAPTLTGNSTVGPSLSGTTSAGSLIRVLVDGNEVGFTTAATDGTWSYSLFGIAAGSHQVTVTAGNAGGTSSPSPAVTVTVTSSGDTTPPARPAAPTVSSTTLATPTLSGTTEAGATVKIYDNGVLIHSLTANGSGAWSWTVSPALASGSHPLTVTATDAAGNVSLASLATTVTVAAGNAAPTVATAAAATPSPVTGTTTALSVLGADDGGEPALTYTWATTGTPPAAVTFSANGTNAAKAVTATFTNAGSYSFQVTITDSANLTVTSTVTVTVNQTLTTMALSPTTVSLAAAATRQFTMTAVDQFGTAMATTPSATWSVLAGGVGTISSTGLYTAPASGTGTATVRATSGSHHADAAVTVTAAGGGGSTVTVGGGSGGGCGVGGTLGLLLGCVLALLPWRMRTSRAAR